MNIFSSFIIPVLLKHSGFPCCLVMLTMLANIIVLVSSFLPSSFLLPELIVFEFLVIQVYIVVDLFYCLYWRHPRLNNIYMFKNLLPETYSVRHPEFLNLQFFKIL